MDVTCERCHTEYEFDDALVSEQGTSVRCTQCGHRFKVKRRDTTGTPEVWIVRTVDGQALEFRALRELKTAISGGKVGRDDVLSRGAGRPRRLASIAELEPFFASPIATTNSGLGAVETQPGRVRSPTPAGLGPSQSARTEHSVAIPLPTMSSEARIARGAAPMNVPPPSPAHAVSPSEAAAFEDDEPTRQRQFTRELYGLGNDAPASVEPPTLIERKRFPDDDGPKTIAGVSPRETPHRKPLAPPDVSIAQAVAEAAESNRSVSRTMAYGTPSTSEASVRGDAMSPRPPPSAVHDTIVDQHRGNGAPSPMDQEVVSEPITARRLPPPAPPPPAPLPPPPAPPPPAPLPPPALADTAMDEREKIGPDSRGDTARGVLPPEPPPGAVPQPAPQAPARAQSATGEDLDEARNKKGKGQHRVSLLTPAPPDTRYSMTHDEADVNPSERRASVLSGRMQSSSMKLIVVLLVGGLAVFGGVLLWTRHVKNTTEQKVSEDPRLAGFLAEGEKKLRDGDHEGAHEQFLKASALGESDPRVAKALARLSTVRAEIPWLELLLLPASDAGRGAVQARYRDAVAQARASSEKAREVAPDDPEVTRVRIDVHRLLGEIDRARALVDGVASLEGQPDTMLAKAALDLSEQRRPSESVVDRLTQCAAQEGNAGRARALLVYALARSGDVKRARAELAQFEKLPKVHPLLAELQRFVDRAEKGEDVALRLEDLPTIGASATPASSSGSASASESTTTALMQAQEALSKGDTTRAEQLFEKVLSTDKNNVPALLGRGNVALRQGQAPLAVAYFQRAVDAAPTNSQALLSLADLKWKTGEQTLAKGLYKRALDAGLSGAAATRARDRSSGATSDPVPTATSTGPVPTSTATATATATATTPPTATATATATSDVPPWDGQ